MRLPNGGGRSHAAADQAARQPQRPCFNLQRPAAGAPADGSSEAEPSPRTNCANRARDSAIEGTHRYGFPQPPLKVISNRPSPRATLVIVKAGVVSDGTGPAVCRLVSVRT